MRYESWINLQRMIRDGQKRGIIVPNITTRHIRINELVNSVKRGTSPSDSTPWEVRIESQPEYHEVMVAEHDYVESNLP